MQELNFESLQITEKYLKHIFGIAIEEIVINSGLVKTRISGLHHDYLGALENQGYTSSIEINCNKIGKGIISCKDSHKKGTFFPKSWTREECLLKIQESLFNIIEKPLFNRGFWEITGITSEEIAIKTLIKPNGELIISYPIYK